MTMIPRQRHAMTALLLMLTLAPSASTESSQLAPAMSNSSALAGASGVGELATADAIIARNAAERKVYESHLAGESIEESVHALATEPLSQLYPPVRQAAQSLLPEPSVFLARICADPRASRVLAFARNAAVEDKLRMLGWVVPELERILAAGPQPGLGHPLDRFTGHLLLPVVLTHVDEKGETLGLLVRILVRLQERGMENLDRGLANIDWSQFKDILPGGLPPKGAPSYVNSNMSDFTLFAVRTMLDRIADRPSMSAKLTEAQRRVLEQYTEFRQAVRGKMQTPPAEPSNSVNWEGWPWVVPSLPEEAAMRIWKEAVSAFVASSRGSCADPNGTLFSLARDFVGL